jgi:Spy/CpxP family protein refolding chaperone
MIRLERVFASLTVAALTAFGAPPVLAAEQSGVDQDIQVIRSLTEAQRQATMAANVNLTDEESTKFWPVYRDYRNDVAKLIDERVAIIKDFADNFTSLTDDKAKSLIKQTLDNQKSRDALKAKYVGKFQKVLPAVKVARVLQIENKLDALVEVGLARSIPLASPPSS